MNKTTKIILGAVIIITVIGVIFLIQQKPSERVTETTQVKIAYYPITHFLPLYVAVEKGYFKDAGFDVELVKFEAPNQVIDAVMNGQVDLTGPGAALGITGIADFKNPGKLKMYAISGDHDNYSGHSLILPINSTITSFNQLKGKKLGIWAGTIQWRTIAREILAQNGLDMDKDLTIVELAPSVQVQALASGQIDALLTLEPIPTTALNNNVAKLWIKSPADQFISDPFWYGVGVINAKFAIDNPKTTEKLVSVIDKAAQEVNQNFDAYRQYLKGYTSLTDELITKVPPIDFKVCNSFTDEDKDSIAKFFNIFTKHKVVDGTINMTDMLYCR
ncbi:MAG: ABC transporter substrate-binding protein [Patescibacteria group bacterium]